MCCIVHVSLHNCAQLHSLNSRSVHVTTCSRQFKTFIMVAKLTVQETVHMYDVTKMLHISSLTEPKSQKAVSQKATNVGSALGCVNSNGPESTRKYVLAQALCVVQQPSTQTNCNLNASMTPWQLITSQSSIKPTVAAPENWMGHCFSKSSEVNHICLSPRISVPWRLIWLWLDSFVALRLLCLDSPVGASGAQSIAHGTACGCCCC